MIRHGDSDIAVASPHHEHIGEAMSTVSTTRIRPAGRALAGGREDLGSASGRPGPVAPSSDVAVDLTGESKPSVTTVGS